ncbi:alpha/beta hydrolase [Companilactobacillus allii]|uniref:AB hydrolase-1 domain-containing protein n=1 Tax=Companilactobacillus allii TaxID=1847728 RepID=A0A1P8PZM5_9LACO|nr:alpha/beta hydrolase [Companilactobacillus allii]APX71073.1 hypothetical protein BTM29_00245 [Companilactobacillus allii]USQ68150.1 alpha/beta hydrolase [Companilactobacillus allii]
MQIKIKNTNLNYKIYGSGKPIYFFHGMSLDSTSLEVVYEPLFKNKNYQRIYLDLPGLGDSQDVHEVNSSDDVLELVIEFIKQISGEKKVAIIGHSYGGYICLGLLAKIPDQIKAAFITCPVIHANKADRKVSVHKNIFLEDVKIGKNADKYQDFVKGNVVINQDAWETYQATVIPGLAKYNRPFWDKIKSEKKYQFSFEDELPLTLSGLQSKTTILLGKNDYIVGYQEQLRLLNSHNNIQELILNDAGHNLLTDISEDLNFYFNKFLKIY